jgi:anti-sigma regulatory factor (Ser/Thr protein kinase)
VLAVDEAITNIIRHAYGGDENQEIILRAESTPDTIEFRLRDFGRQADPETFKSRKLADVRPGGLGCHLIEQGFDTVTYDINFPRGPSFAWSSDSCGEKREGAMRTMVMRFRVIAS